MVAAAAAATPAPAPGAGLGPEKEGDPSAPSITTTSSSAKSSNASSASTIPPEAEPPLPDTTTAITTGTAANEAQPPVPQDPPSTTSPSAAPTPESTRTPLQTTLILLSLASALFLAALDVTIVTVAIPTIALEFRSTATGYTWIGSAYMLATAAAAPVWGKVSDIWGRKPVMLVAVGVFWVGSLLSGVSRGMGMLIAARAIQGVGGGGIVILVNVCIGDLFSLRKRGEFSFRFIVVCCCWDTLPLFVSVRQSG